MFCLGLFVCLIARLLENLWNDVLFKRSEKKGRGTRNSRSDFVVDLEAGMEKNLE